MINAGNFQTFDAALAACPSGACTIQFPAGTLTTQLYSGKGCISRSNIALRGAATPQLDSAAVPTRLVGGTIIQPGLAFCGASNVAVFDIGFDDGPAYFAATGVATDGLIFEGATGAVGEPLVSGISVSREIALGSSSNAQVHANLIEHATNVTLTDLTAVMDTHCNVIKSQNVTATRLQGLGCSNDSGLIIKSDGYTAVNNVTVDQVSASAINPGDTYNALIIDAEGANAVSHVMVNNLKSTGVQFAMNLLNNTTLGENGLTDISITGVQAVLSNLPAGRTPSCILSQTNSGGHPATNVMVSKVTCDNETPMAAAPIEIYNDWTGSQIKNWSSLNGGYCSTLGGTINVTGWVDTGSASTVPTLCTADPSTVVVVTGYSSTRGNSPYGSLATGSQLTVSP